MISFLEVNTRLQVEHPVSEETSGVDLVREQFRIAEGETLRVHRGPDPARALDRVPDQRRGPGREASCPPPGTVTASRCRPGPGVRVDSGIEAGSVIGGAFDSLLAKLIVTGETGAQALERSRRALGEFEVEGMATVLPFHRLVVDDPAFADRRRSRVLTRWIETEFDNTIAPFDGRRRGRGRAGPRQTVVVEVGGRRLEVSLPAGLALGGGGGARGRGEGGAPQAPRRARRRRCRATR